MRLKTLLLACSALLCASMTCAPSAHAYPLDPAKVPVAIGQSSAADHTFTLAYDSSDKSIIYYAPKGGRVAIMNGMPLVSFAVAPTGEGYLNAQLEFGVFGPEKNDLFGDIERSGFRPVPFPYFRSTVRPVTPNNDPITGKQICVQVTDPSTGLVTENCDPTLYSALSYSRSGPSLGENVAISATLTKVGAAIYSSMLRGGDALQVVLDADYYKAGTAFTAKVTVDYSKLYEQLHTYVAASGIFASAQWEGAWENAGLCFNRPASDCAVRITYTDERGRSIDNVAVDPTNRDQQTDLLQAVDRLRDELQGDMLTPVAATLAPGHGSAPLVGFKLNAEYEHSVVQKHATFEFKSPMGVNVGHTAIPTGIACIVMSKDGDVSRNTAGDCANYWAGSLGFDGIIAASAGKGAR